MSERGVIVKQGPLDGLCGLYCLVNSIRGWGCFERSKETNDPDALRYLLEAANRLGIFTVNRVCGGFEAHELVDIFNEFSRAHDYPWRAELLRSYLAQAPNLTRADAFRELFKLGGEVVIPVERGEHWVLAFGYSDANKLLIEDPDPSENQSELTLAIQRSPKGDGVVLQKIQAMKN